MSSPQSDNLPEAERRQWVQFGQQAAGADQSRATTPATIDVEQQHVHPGADHAVVDMEPVNQLTPVQSPLKSIKSSATVERGASLHDVSLADENGAAGGTHTTVTASNTIARASRENGAVIVSILPLNTKLPWITPAQFRPELVPEELMASDLTLTVEEYVQAMELLVNDVRFNAYNICYKRLLVGWIVVGFVVLLAILFGSRPGLQLFGAGIVWLIVNAAAIFGCMYVKIKLNRELERCVALVNRVFMRHNMLLGVDDRGHLSCHKVNLCFIYFNSTQCVRRLHEVLDKHPDAVPVGDTAADARDRARQLQRRMDIDDSDIIITGGRNTRISRKQERAERLFLRYSQRWAKDLLRKRLDWTVDMSERLDSDNSTQAGPRRGAQGTGVNTPRHVSTARCPCQYIEDHLNWKPVGRQSCQVVPGCCATLFD